MSTREKIQAAVGSPPAEFAAFVQREVTRWIDVAHKAELKPES